MYRTPASAFTETVNRAAVNCTGTAKCTIILLVIIPSCMREVQTDKAQSANSLLSQAIISRDLVFTAGFIHVTPGGRLETGSVGKMLARIMKNISAVLKAAGTDLDHVIKATVYVTDMAMLGELNKHFSTYFKSPLPAREAVCVKDLPLGAQIEISVIAEL